MQENFPALICHSSRGKCIHLQTGGGGRRKTCARHGNCRKKSLMVKDDYQLFLCIVVYVYNYPKELPHEINV
jgi:hypothetical protein